MKRNKIFNYIFLVSFVFFIGFSNIYAYEDTCITCGSESLSIPVGIPNFVSKLITFAQIMVPVLIIVVGMVKYVKAVTSGDDKVIKETNSSFIRSLIAGVSIFLLFAIVKFAFSLLGPEGTSTMACVNCFMTGECNEVACPDRGQKPGTVKMSCTDYKSELWCKNVDNYGNVCHWNKDLGICEQGEKAKQCNDYLYDDCPSKDDFNYLCKQTSRHEQFQCVRTTTAPFCANYTTEAECPAIDAYGDVCKWGHYDGRPQCYSFTKSKECSEYSLDICKQDVVDSSGNKCIVSGDKCVKEG